MLVVQCTSAFRIRKKILKVNVLNNTQRVGCKPIASQGLTSSEVPQAENILSQYLEDTRRERMAAQSGKQFQYAQLACVYGASLTGCVHTFSQQPGAARFRNLGPLFAQGGNELDCFCAEKDSGGVRINRLSDDEAFSVSRNQGRTIANTMVKLVDIDDPSHKVTVPPPPPLPSQNPSMFSACTNCAAALRPSITEELSGDSVDTNIDWEDSVIPREPSRWYMSVHR